MLEPGTRVADYRIESILGHGATSTVYAATQLSLGRLVALKLLDRGPILEPQWLERFRREGRLQAGLDHPRILAVIEAGESERGLYLVTRLVDGPNLATMIGDRRLTAARALHLLEQIADALDFAHGAGFVHRDVKPQNVLVGPGDRAFLADFGLVRAMGATTFTGSGQVFGTVAYVAPEVVRGDAATEASDRYSFAAMTFECLAGCVPFRQATDVGVLFAHLGTQAPAISELRPGLPRKLDGLLRKGLAKEPGQRPASAREFIDALRETIGGRALATLDAPRIRDPEDPASPPAAPGRRHLRAIAGLGGAVLAGAAVAVVIGTGQGAAGTTAVSSTASGLVLGSQLAGDDVVSFDCQGEPPRPGSPSCTIVQRGLPGATLSAPRSGTVVAWSVRGASGTLRLQVVRRIGDGYREVYGSQPRVASSGGVVSFPANSRIERGDRIGVELAPGASIGVRQMDRASTLRWLGPLSIVTAPQTPSGPSNGLDGELMLRAEIAPGAAPTQPQELHGRPARKVELGPALDAQEVTLNGHVYEISVGNDERDIALTLERDGRRIALMPIPKLDAGDRLTRFELISEAGRAHLYVRFYTDATRQSVYNEFVVTPEGFELVA